MYNLLVSSDYTNKRRMSNFDDSNDTKNAWRLFRDTVTDAYIETYFSDPSIVIDFLDYTYHFIYSSILIGINKGILSYNESNQKYHIKPICGPENIFLIFKGGTIMNMLYSKYINEISIKYRDIKIDAISEYFSNVLDQKIKLSDLNIDLETGNAYNNNNFGSFCDILKKKFAVSDIDYSLFINAETSERFDIIHKFVILELGKALDNISTIFENYFNSVQENYPKNDNDDFDNIPNSTDDENYRYSTLLVELKNFIYFKQKINIDNISYEINDNVTEFIKTFDPTAITHLYYLYDGLQIVDLLLYIKSVNSSDIFQTIDVISLRFNIVAKINLLVSKKINNLMKGNYYTREKKAILLKKIANKFNNNRINPDIMNTKYEKIDTPGKNPEITIQNYKLRDTPHKIINEVPIYYDESDFMISPRASVIVTSSNDPIKHTKIKSSNDKKIHYITHNTIINKTRNYGNVTVNFDLMRIKFNVKPSKDNEMFETNPQKNVYLPSEFIDVSIPRYDDNGRIAFFDNIIKKKQCVPPILGVSINNKKVCVYGYDPEYVLHDLEYVLSGQNGCEPWTDHKYKKRIIRLGVFIILSTYCEIQLSGENHMNSVVDLIKMTKTSYDYVSSNGEFPFDSITTALIQKNKVNGKILIKDLRDNLISYMGNKYINYSYLLRDEYPLKYFITPFIISFLCALDNGDDTLLTFLNIISYTYKQVSHTKTAADTGTVKKSFGLMCQILYDYCAKLYYVFSLELINQQNGGDNTFYKDRYSKNKRNYIILKDGKEKNNILTINPNTKVNTKVNNEPTYIKHDIHYLRSMSHTNNKALLHTTFGKITIGKSRNIFDYSIYKDTIPISTVISDI
jgi:hypothetical protein